ncbi:Hypothetical predicted protein [Cloeon dipterum]|uniref:Bee-milk protein n=1 Tax=Cloeon dipterum TaxID=197152 RepID=A0A8S1E906_9INSE|nr:Hypothetical predicted protein [Cloeon dipterum]
MCPFVCAIFLLCLSSLSTAAKFTQVYKWSEMDFEWPSEATRTQALETGTYNPEKIYPRYMAVYGTRMFLSLEKLVGIPATLVSLPTTSASYAPPKLTPFPSWDLHLHDFGSCNKIEWAVGLQVDSVGRLWVLDSGSDNYCNAKLWTIDLINNDDTKIIHRFPFHGWMHDLVIDETANGTFAYISRWGELHMVVFSLEQNESWRVNTPRTRVISLALSPKEKPRELYLGKYNSQELYSIPVTALHSGAKTAHPKRIGKWSTIDSYRMVMDNNGTVYSAFLSDNIIQFWNTTQKFQAQRFYEAAGLDSFWPFTFAADPHGTLWIAVFDEERKPRYRLLNSF